MNEYILIDDFIKYDPWNYKHLPKSIVKLTYIKDLGFKVEMKSYEKNLRTECKTENSSVYEDSCLECFINFYPKENDKYLNFEVNPLGTMLAEVGTNKFDRNYIKNFNIEHPKVDAKINDDSWEISYIIPLKLIKEIYGKNEFKKDDVIKVNFYKCGDLTIHPHYGAYNNIINEVPNFHLPIFFKEIKL